MRSITEPHDTIALLGADADVGTAVVHGGGVPGVGVPGTVYRDMDQDQYSTGHKPRPWPWTQT